MASSPSLKRVAFDRLLSYGRIARRGGPSAVAIPILDLAAGTEFAEELLRELEKYQGSYKTERLLSEAYEKRLKAIKDLCGGKSFLIHRDQILAVLDGA